MKNILYFEPSSGIGGSGNNLRLLLANLDIKKYRPFVIARCVGPQIEKIKNLGCPISIMPLNKIEGKNASKQIVSYVSLSIDFLFRILPIALKMVFFIKKNKIALVHVNANIISGLLGIIAAKLSGIPCICHIRITKKKFINRERFFGKLVDRSILVNKEAYQLYAKYFGKNKVVLICDGINVNEFVEQAKISDPKQNLGFTGHSTIGLIGRLVEGKGHDDFIKAASKVLKEVPNARFLIVGDDPDPKKPILQHLKKIATECNVDKSIIFTGWRNDIAYIMSNLNIIVQATSYFPEGFSNIVFEAMACKKPLIATDIAGQNEALMDNETGFLIPPSDPKVMAEKIVYLLKNPDIAKKMGLAGRKRVEEMFDIKKTARETEAIYEEILNQRSKKNVFYKLQRVFDFVTYPIRIASTYIKVKKLASRNNENVYLKTGSYITLDGIGADKDKEEILLGDIDQDSRLLSYVGKIPYFVNISKEEFFPRKRYKLQLVALKYKDKNIIAIKKYFGKDRLGFIRESFILDKLSSCNVPKLLKIDTARHIVYMTFIPGISLREELAKNGAKVKDVDYLRLKNENGLKEKDIKKLKLSSANNFIMQVAGEEFLSKLYSELMHIHSKGVILGDIKYGNIIKTKNNEPFFVDFHDATIVSKRNGLAFDQTQKKDRERLHILFNGK